MEQGSMWVLCHIWYSIFRGGYHMATVMLYIGNMAESLKEWHAIH